MINPVNAIIRLPVSELLGAPKVYSLDGTGKRTGEVEVEIKDAQYVIAIGGKYKTLWYELSVE